MLPGGRSKIPGRFRIVVALIEAMVSIIVMQEAKLEKKIEQNTHSTVLNSVGSFGRGAASILGLSNPIKQGKDHQPNPTRMPTAKEK
jgi:hypothetical protein